MKPRQEIKEHLEFLADAGGASHTLTTLIDARVDYYNMARNAKAGGPFDSFFYRGFYPMLREIYYQRIGIKELRQLYIKMYEGRRIPEKNAVAFALNWETPKLGAYR